MGGRRTEGTTSASCISIGTDGSHRPTRSWWFGEAGTPVAANGGWQDRVAVQALVEAYKRRDVAGPILWIAPTVELCEQAVQTWAYVWRAIGPDERLRLNRLSESNEVEQSTDGFQVVVATDAKMSVVIDRPRYQWLSQATFVVVDEAHGSTESGYTQILHWLGLGPDQRKDRCPLLGLTATPFKGTSEEATGRLLARYGRQRLDEGVLGDDPYRELQRMGVLAQASQRVLGGATVELTLEEAEAARRTNRLPPKVEADLSADEGRNAVILRTITDLPSDWKILLFAASVSHAEQMAAILTMRGIPAAPISAGTNPAARRFYIRQFNEGPLRVLTNLWGTCRGFRRSFGARSDRRTVDAEPECLPTDDWAWPSWTAEWR